MAQTASTTQTLGLNQWNSSDDLNTTQFNEDNRLIDVAVGVINNELVGLNGRAGDIEDDVDEIRQEIEQGDLTGHDNTARAIINRIYNGVDLTIKFADEIAEAPFNGNVWAWIQARIQAGNFTGLFVGDFIPFEIATHTIIAEIAGINTYTRYGDVEVENHIDFISRDCFPDVRQFNRANYNNGTSVSPSPYLASDLFAWLNGLQRQVPNAATANPALVSVDYGTTGLFPRLPAALRNVIVQKRLLLPTRFTAGALLTNDNSWAWNDAGNLWIPAEMEVYGTNVWGSNISAQQGFAIGGFVQYPIFANNMKRVKGAGHEGIRASWWLLSAHGGNSTTFAPVNSNGRASIALASNTSIRVPVCFRIA